ncbi:MAG: DUF58 domain-containing protein [Motiliproteus sp.]
MASDDSGLNSDSPQRDQRTRSGRFDSLRGWFRQRFERWLSHRLPRSRITTLNQRRIFIIPSRNGGLFLLMAGVLFLGGINYGNSLILMVAMLLVSLFLVSILHTYRNLSGLTLEAGRTGPAFVGQQVAFAIHFSSNRQHEAISIGWPEQPSQQLNLLDSRRDEMTLMLPVSRRGLCRFPRFKVESTFPLGLLRAWSWIELDAQSLVYPRPIEAAYPLSEAPQGDHGDRVSREGSDDFDGLRRYQEGDSFKRIAWKSYARHRQLHSKTFAGYQAQEHWLEWQAYSGMAIESRLGRLCHQVLQRDRQGQRFGLRIPGLEVMPSRGDSHRQHCLRALALYGLAPPAVSGVATGSDHDGKPDRVTASDPPPLQGDTL